MNLCAHKTAFAPRDSSTAGIKVSRGVRRGVSKGVFRRVRRGVSKGVFRGVRRGVSEGVFRGIRRRVSKGVSTFQYTRSCCYGD
jgi:hypothetical protein